MFFNLFKDDPLDEDELIDREEQKATEKAFGIKPTGKHLRVTTQECSALRRELGVDSGTYELRSVLVHGIDGMQEYQIKKVFISFQSTEVFMVDEHSAIVQFATRQSAAAMFLNMTKMIRRVRGKKKADEDGEVMSDNDDDLEEGQFVNERGDDVEVIDDLKPDDNGIVSGDQEFITINVDVRKIPDGKWRLVTQHVPKNRFIIARYPTIKEYDAVPKPEEEPKEVSKKRSNIDNEFWSHNKEYHSGLNVFDKDGNELDWDYEHDTRFYEKEDNDKGKKDGDDKFVLPTGVKKRGRGSVKCGFLFGKEESSLNADSHVEKKRKMTVEDPEEIYKKDDVLARMPASRLEGRISYRK